MILVAPSFSEGPGGPCFRASSMSSGCSSRKTCLAPRGLRAGEDLAVAIPPPPIAKLLRLTAGLSEELVAENRQLRRQVPTHDADSEGEVRICNGFRHWS